MSTPNAAVGASFARAPLSFRRYTVGMALRIKELRQKAGMTQGDLAARSGIDRTQLSKIENEKEPANTRRLAAIARALNVTVDQLFAGDDADALRAAIVSVLDDLTPDQRAAVLEHARALASLRQSKD